jgi:hypothetical protein
MMWITTRRMSIVLLVTSWFRRERTENVWIGAEEGT